ncbi:MAG: DotA/TraY family protein, partial [Candidatus Adiutrix sp.]
VAFSINVANFVWDKGIDFFVESGGRISLQAPETTVAASEVMGKQILNALVIQNYLTTQMDLPTGGYTPMFVPAAPGSETGSYVFTFDVPDNFTANDLGRIEMPCAAEHDMMCIARARAVINLIESLGPVADVLADPNQRLELHMSGELARAVHQYQMEVQPTLAMAETDAENKLRADLESFGNVAKENGWITAGAYYWNISQLNERARQAMYVNITMSAPNNNVIGAASMRDFTTVKKRYENYVNDAFSLERYSNAITSNSKPDEYSWDWLKSKISVPIGAYGMGKIMEKLKTKDPISTMTTLGNYLVTGTEGFIIAQAGAMGLVSFGKAAAGGWIANFASGGLSGAVGEGFKATFVSLLNYFVVLSYVLISYGFFLAYFLPAIPLVLWISAVIGWVILVLESLVAAPLWVAAHALPEGEGFTGNAGRLGYMLFLGVFLRPPLMVFGFLIAISLINVFGFIIGLIFSSFVFEFLGDTVFGISAFLAYIFILGSVIITATYKIFGLISYLPERVTNWIGQQFHSLGEKEDMASAKGQFAQGGKISNAIGSSGG